MLKVANIRSAYVLLYDRIKFIIIHVDINIFAIFLEMLCHTREGGYPFFLLDWIPAFAGKTY